jgi:hypothetical protein
MTTTKATSKTSPDRTPDRPRRARLLARRGLLLAAALALVAAACGGDDGDTATADAGGESSGGGGGGGGGDMTIDFVSPTDGDSLEAPFEVEVDPSVDIGEPDTGLHHVHLYYDGNISEDQSDYDILYEPTFEVDRDLGEGEHTLEAVIANADHSLTDTSAEITVTVGAGGAGGGTDATDPGGYDY